MRSNLHSQVSVQVDRLLEIVHAGHVGFDSLEKRKNVIEVDYKKLVQNIPEDIIKCWNVLGTLQKSKDITGYSKCPYRV